MDKDFSPCPETANTAATEFLSSRLVVAEVEQGGGMCARCAKSFEDCDCLQSHNCFRV